MASHLMTVRGLHPSPPRLLRAGRALPVLLLTLLLGTTASAEVAVVRPVVRAPGGDKSAGTAFFIPAPTPAGVAGVAAAHNVDPAVLAHANEVEFQRGATRERIAHATRVLAPPGRPLSAPGGTVRGDFVILLPEAKPEDVRVLEPEPVLPEEGRRVRLLGVPARLPKDQEELFGTVVEASDEKIEVRLDAIADLRGWGGAPVLDERTGRVLGLLQGARPADGTYVLAVGPIGAVTAALADPLDGGEGRAFASFPVEGSAASSVARAPSGTPVPPATSPATGATPIMQPPATGGTPGMQPSVAGVTPVMQPPAAAAQAGAPSGDPGDPAPLPRTPVAAAPTRPPGGSLLGQKPAGPGRLELTVEQPTDGAVTGDPNGAFLAGRALALAGEFRKFDIAIVLDVSGSTAEPSGADVNGNGVVGRGTFGLFGPGTSDPGDSILAAEVAAARQLLAGLDPRTTRVSLVSFAGEPPMQGGMFAPAPPPPAITEEPLTTNYDRIHQALSRVMQRGPYGNTHMAAGVDQAVIELKGFQGALSQPDPQSEKVVLFLTDGQPTLPCPVAGCEGRNVHAVLRAAERAKRSAVRVHSFAIGPEALAGPVAVVELAARTGGYFTPVRNPADLVQLVEQVRFSNVEELAVKNLSTEAVAEQVLVNADGSWSALVPLQAGKNRLEVTARASDGAQAREEVTVSYAPGAPAPAIPRELVAQRNRLLEQKLLELRQETKTVELEAVSRARKELALEIEREREQARERAEQQRKELQLEVDPGIEEPDTP